MLLVKTFHPTTGPRLFGPNYSVSEKNSMLPSNVERGHALSAVAAFSSKSFVSNILMHKIMAS